MLLSGSKYHQRRLAQVPFLWANDNWRCAVLLLLPVQLHTQAAVRQDAEMSCTHENEQVFNQNSAGEGLGAWPVCHCACFLLSTFFNCQHHPLHSTFRRGQQNYAFFFFFSFIVGNAFNFSCFLLCTSEECLRNKPEHTGRQPGSTNAQEPTVLEPGCGWGTIGFRLQPPPHTVLSWATSTQGWHTELLGISTHFSVPAINVSTKISWQIILCHHPHIFLLFSVTDKRTGPKARKLEKHMHRSLLIGNITTPLHYTIKSVLWRPTQFLHGFRLLQTI